MVKQKKSTMVFDHSYNVENSLYEFDIVKSEGSFTIIFGKMDKWKSEKKILIKEMVN